MSIEQGVCASVRPCVRPSVLPCVRAFVRPCVRELFAYLPASPRAACRLSVKKNFIAFLKAGTVYFLKYIAFLSFLLFITPLYFSSLHLHVFSPSFPS